MTTFTNKIHKEQEPSFDVELNIANQVAQGVNATLSGLQSNALQEAINSYAQTLNESAIAKSTGLPVRTPSSQYKGFAAEEFHKLRIKINALAKGVPAWKIGSYTKGALPDGTNLSGIDMETDIAIYSRKYPWNTPKPIARYQSKIHNNPAKYTKDITNPQYKNVDFVGGANQGVNDTIKAKIGSKTISSDPITPEEAEQLADAMKKQKAPSYPKSTEKKAELNRVKLTHAIAMGAATGAITATIREIIFVIKERDNLSKDQWTQAIKRILCGTADGAVQSGAIAGGVQLLGKALGKNISESSIAAVPVMAIAALSTNFAKDLYEVFVSHTLSPDDLLCKTVNNTFSSFANFGGSWLGGQIASSYLSAQTAAATGASIGSALGPLGTAIGAALGGLIIGVGASCIIKSANNDAQEAFNQCITDINTKITNAGLKGFDSLYYFADSISELSEFKLSFKNLLPCYNLISDLKEYNLRKKAINRVYEQLNDTLENINETKRQALKALEQQHLARLKELKSCFKAQQYVMYKQSTMSMKTYVSNAYAQYIETFNRCQIDIHSLEEQINREAVESNEILIRLQSRNVANEQLNNTLKELMGNSELDSFTKHTKPFISQLLEEIKKENLVLEKQYLSLEEALAIQGNG